MSKGNKVTKTSKVRYLDKEFRPYGEKWVYNTLSNHVSRTTLEKILINEDVGKIPSTATKPQLVQAVMEIYKKAPKEGQARLEKYLYSHRYRNNVKRKDPFLKRLDKFFNYMENNPYHKIKVGPAIASKFIKSASTQNITDGNMIKEEMKAAVCKNRKDYEAFDMLFDLHFNDNYSGIVPDSPNTSFASYSTKAPKPSFNNKSMRNSIASSLGQIMDYEPEPENNPLEEIDGDKPPKNKRPKRNSPIKEPKEPKEPNEPTKSKEPTKPKGNKKDEPLDDPIEDYDHENENGQKSGGRKSLPKCTKCKSTDLKTSPHPTKQNKELVICQNCGHEMERKKSDEGGGDGGKQTCPNCQSTNTEIKPHPTDKNLEIFHCNDCGYEEEREKEDGGGGDGGNEQCDNCGSTNLETKLHPTKKDTKIIICLDCGHEKEEEMKEPEDQKCSNCGSTDIEMDNHPNKEGYIIITCNSCGHVEEKKQNDGGGGGDPQPTEKCDNCGSEDLVTYDHPTNSKKYIVKCISCGHEKEKPKPPEPPEPKCPDCGSTRLSKEPHPDDENKIIIRCLDCGHKEIKPKPEEPKERCINCGSENIEEVDHPTDSTKTIIRCLDCGFEQEKDKPKPEKPKCPQCGSEELDQQLNGNKVTITCLQCGWKMEQELPNKPKNELEQAIIESLIEECHILKFGVYMGYTEEETMRRISNVKVQIDPSIDSYAKGAASPPSDWKGDGSGWNMLLSSTHGELIKKYIHKDERPMEYWELIETVQHEYIHILTDLPIKHNGVDYADFEFEEAKTPLIQYIIVHHHNAAVNPYLLAHTENRFEMMSLKKGHDEKRVPYKPNTFKYFDQLVTIYYASERNAKENPNTLSLFQRIIQRYVQEKPNQENLHKMLKEMYPFWRR